MWRSFIEWLRSLFNKKGGGGVEATTLTQELQKNKWAGLNQYIAQHDILLKSIVLQQSYYDGKHAVLVRQPKRADDPNHRLVINYAKLIVNLPTDYMVGKPVSVEVPDIAASKYGADLERLKGFRQKLEDVREDNSDHHIDFTTVRNGLTAGGAGVLFYFDHRLDIRYRAYPLNRLFPVTNEYGDIIGAIHRYTKEEVRNGTTETAEYVEWYDDTHVYYLKRDGTDLVDDPRKEVKVAYHQFPMVPIAWFRGDEAQTPPTTDIPMGMSVIDDPSITVIDEINRALSDNANKMDVFNDPFLKFIGEFPKPEEMDKMRTSRAVGSKNPQAVIEYLAPPIDEKPIVAHLKELTERLFDVAQLPKIYKDTANGNLSGVAIQQMYAPLEIATNAREIHFNEYYRRKNMLLTYGIQAKDWMIEGKDTVAEWQSVAESQDTSMLYNWRWIYWTVHRNLPINVSEYVTMLTGQKDFISDETILQLNPLVENATEEKERLERQKADRKQVDLDNIDGYIDGADKKIEKRSTEDDEE